MIWPCQWFASCDQEADGVLWYPSAGALDPRSDDEVGYVPTCSLCAGLIGRSAELRASMKVHS